MFDLFMGGTGGNFGFGGYDEGPDPYEFVLDGEPDEHRDLMLRLAACMPLYKCETFEDTLESACYVCNVDRESLSEEDVDWLEEMYEEEE